MADRVYHKKLNSGTVWRIAIILAILCLVSWLLLYVVLGSFSHGEVNVISLSPGHNPTNEPPTLTQTGEESWEYKRDIDLFKTTYTNANGDVVIQSSNGDKVIAPGASNSYHFSLKNTGNISMDFVMKLDGIFTLENTQLPFEVRLRTGDTWLVGSADEWLAPEQLNEVQVANTLKRDNYIRYTLEWRWPYEQSEDVLLGDLNDTLIGNAGVAEDVDFTLKIVTVATITEGALPYSKGGFIQITEMWPAGVVYTVLFMAIAIVLVALLLVILKVNKRHRAKQKIIDVSSGGKQDPPN